MRSIITAVFLFSLPATAAFAAPAFTAQQAAAEAESDGFSRVALTEATQGGWDLWASKDGIAYELKIDARTGAVLEQVPLDTDD